MTALVLAACGGSDKAVIVPLEGTSGSTMESWCAGKMTCTWQADFDGDGKSDRARQVHPHGCTPDYPPCPIGLEFELSKLGRVVLGGGVALDVPWLDGADTEAMGMVRLDADLQWIKEAHVMPVQDDAAGRFLLHGMSGQLRPPHLDGDGMFLTSNDAAIAVCWIGGQPAAFALGY